MLKILVTGGNGQLGTCIKKAAAEYTDTLLFVFKSSSELDITDEKAVYDAFEEGKYRYCINSAGYTNVDGAEENKTLATRVNSTAVNYLTQVCNRFDATLIHISTDFVFDGSQNTPYIEGDIPKACSVYGSTKLQGEEFIRANAEKYFIFRTSWLYAEHGHNFLKSMLKYGTERERLGVVFDQIGTPTYAGDLAEVLVLFMVKEIREYGIFHFSNEGVASWYDFAKAIFEINAIDVILRPIRTSEYPLPAQRPSYSVLDKSKIKKTLNIEISYWKDSLQKACGLLE